MNTSTKRILIYVDQKRRDLFSMHRIYLKLKSYSDIDVRMSGKVDFLFTLQGFNPHIIIFGKNDGYHGDWLRSIKGATIFSIHTEQGYASKNDTINNFINGHVHVRPPNIKSVDYFFLGSEITKQHLAGFIPEEKMLVVGYPRLLSREYAVKPQKVSSTFTIGIACGKNIGNSDEIQSYFETYYDNDFGSLGSVKGLLSYLMLERCMIEHVVIKLKEEYNLVVRYRFGDDEYLQDKSGVQIDKSDSPRGFIEDCDLIILGQTTLGIESMMCGIPAISITKMLDINNAFDTISDFSYIKACWQPRTDKELFELIKKRRENYLELSPDVGSYESLVSKTYYCGGKVDNSVEKICSAIIDCPIKSKDGASIDLQILGKLLNMSAIKIKILQLCKTKISQLLIFFIILRVKVMFFLRREKTLDTYFPKFSGKK